MTAQEFNTAAANRSTQAVLASLRAELPELGPGVDPNAQQLQTAALIFANLSTVERRQFIQDARAKASQEITALNQAFAAL